MTSTEPKTAPTRFSLEPGHWYACMFFGDEFDASAMCFDSVSPIRVDRVTPRKNGSRTFELAFFHANYPEGVQDKIYNLKTISRGNSGLLAQAIDHTPPRFVYINDITIGWLRNHYPERDFESGALEDCLARNFAS